jgi:hypothetical protein
MLGDDGDESLKTAQDGTMYHHRSRFRIVGVLASELEIETLRQLEVELDGRTLERAAEAVPDADVDLGAVESAVAGIDLPFPGILLFKRLFELLIRKKLSSATGEHGANLHPLRNPRS